MAEQMSVKKRRSGRTRRAALSAALVMSLGPLAAQAQGGRDMPAPGGVIQLAAAAEMNDDGNFPPPPAKAAPFAGADNNSADNNNAEFSGLRSAPPAAAAGEAAAAANSAAGEPVISAAGAAQPAAPAEQNLELRVLQQQVEELQNRVDRLEAAQQNSAGNSAGQSAPAAAPAGPAAPAAAATAPAPAKDDEAYAVPAGIEADALYQSGQDFMAQAHYAKAAAVWRAFGERFPDDERAAAAAFELGECYYARGLYAKAAEAYLNVQAKYKTAPMAPRSLLRLALSMAELQDRQTACAALEQLARNYPQADPTLLQQGGEAARRLQCP